MGDGYGEVSAVGVEASIVVAARTNTREGLRHCQQKRHPPHVNGDVMSERCVPDDRTAYAEGRPN